MSHISNLPLATIVRTGLANKCARRGCDVPFVHRVGTCLPTELRGTLAPCNEPTCMDLMIHGVGDCNPDYRDCLLQEHLGAGHHLVHNCKQYPGTFPEALVGYGTNQLHPTLGTINKAVTFADLQKSSVTPSTELVLYTGPNLVHVPELPETPIENEPRADFRSCPDPDACPARGDHTNARTCDSFNPKPKQRPVVNKVTLKTRAARLSSRTWHNRHAISTSIMEELIGLVAMLPLLLGVLNSLFAVEGVQVLLSVLTNTTDLTSSFILLISTCMYASAFLIVLPAWTHYFTFPGGTRFDQYHRKLTFGSSLLVTSVIVEIIVAYIFLQR